MKLPLIFSTAAFLTLFSGCGRSADARELIELAQKQTQTIQAQQEMLLDQQQSIADQETRIAILIEQMRSDEEILRQIRDELLARRTDAVVLPVVDANIDANKSVVVKSLAGFNGRLSASIGYSAYADALSDLNSSVATSLLQVKDPNFVEAVKDIVRIYNLGGDFWEKFVRENSEDITLSPTDRSRYATVGVLFVDNYHPRPPDVRKFWRVAATRLQSLMETNQQELGIASTAFRR